MLHSIASLCSNSNVLHHISHNFGKIEVSQISKTDSISKPLADLQELIQNLTLSHFGSVSSLRSKYSILPDSLIDLEIGTGLLNGKSKASLFGPQPFIHTIDGYNEMNSTMLTVYEDPKNRFIMQVFMLPQGCVMPLHDHPGMHVITKVLIGSVDIASFSFVNPDMKESNFNTTFNFNSASTLSFEKLKPILSYGSKQVHPIKRVLMTSNSESSISLLQPHIGNLHSMRANENTIFFDILSPPYAPPKIDCTYYSLTRYSNDGVVMGYEEEGTTVHSTYPKPNLPTDDFWVASPFTPNKFMCREVAWRGEEILL